MIDRTPTLKVLVYDGPESDIKRGALEKIRAAHEGGIRILTLEEFMKLGKENPVKPNYPEPEDIATIMYTSGSSMWFFFFFFLI